MKFEKLLPFFKWAIYYLLLILAYVLQTIPELFQICGIKPVLIVPLVISICMFESVMPSVAYAVVAGLLWDISSDKLMGFNAVILLLCAMMISLLCIYYLRTKLLNSVIFIAATMLIQGFADYAFYYAIWTKGSDIFILTTQILPTALYSVILSPIAYFIIKFVEKKFNPVVRM